MVQRLRPAETRPVRAMAWRSGAAERERWRHTGPGPAHHVYWPMMRSGETGPVERERPGTGAFNYSHQISAWRSDENTRAHCRKISQIYFKLNWRSKPSALLSVSTLSIFSWIKSDFYDECLALVDRHQAQARLGLAQLRSNGSMTLGAQIVTLCCLQSALNNNTGKNCISRPLALSLSLAATCNKTVQCLQCPHRCSHITPWCTHWHRYTALTAAVTPHSLRTWGFLLFTPLMRHVTSLIWHRVVTSTDVTPSTHCGQLARCQQTVTAVRAEPGGEWRGPGADTETSAGIGHGH